MHNALHKAQEHTGVCLHLFHLFNQGLMHYLILLKELLVSFFEVLQQLSIGVSLPLCCGQEQNNNELIFFYQAIRNITEVQQLSYT